MSSIAYNLTRKMEWMGRRLRKIDDVEEIKQWVSAMREINDLLKEVDIKDCKDAWRPWSQSTQRGKKVGKTDQIASKRRRLESRKPHLKNWKTEKVQQVGLEVSPGEELKKNEDLEMLPAQERSHRATSRLPRVEEDGDEVEMLEKRCPPRVEVDGEDDRMDPKAAVMEMLEKAEREEKKRNREIWKKGMLDRVKKENVPVEHWGTINSGNFKIMMGDCAPHRVRVAVVKDMGGQEVNEWLYKELMKFYDKR